MKIHHVSGSCDMIFIQLPSTLPGLPPSREEDVKPKIKTEPGMSNAGDATAKTTTSDKNDDVSYHKRNYVQ